MRTKALKQELESLRHEANATIRQLADQVHAAHQEVEQCQEVFALVDVNTNALMAEVQRLRQLVRNLSAELAYYKRL